MPDKNQLQSYPKIQLDDFLEKVFQYIKIKETQIVVFREIINVHCVLRSFTDTSYVSKANGLLRSILHMREKFLFFHGTLWKLRRFSLTFSWREIKHHMSKVKKGRFRKQWIFSYYCKDHEIEWSKLDCIDILLRFFNKARTKYRLCAILIRIKDKTKISLNRCGIKDLHKISLFGKYHNEKLLSLTKNVSSNQQCIY